MQLAFSIVYSAGFPDPGMGPTTIKMGLLASINVIKVIINSFSKANLNADNSSQVYLEASLRLALDFK